MSTAMFHLKPAKHQIESHLTLLLGADQDAWSQWLQHCDETYGTVEEEWARVMGNTPVHTQADAIAAKRRAATLAPMVTKAPATGADRLLDIIHRFEGVQPAGRDKWMAFCQAHQDGKTQKRRSLSLKIVDGKILVHCFAGCSTLDAVAAAGLTMSDLFEGDGIAPATSSSATVEAVWPAPLPIPDDMPAAPELTREMLPPALRDWIFDIAHRMQCPPDYPAAAALVALGTIVGKKVQLLPKHHDNWAVVPNLWGFVVGAPGVLKSPATKQALGPLFRIAQEERDKAAKEAGRIEAQAEEIERLKAQIKGEKKGDHLTMLKEELAVMEKNMADEKPPVVRRLITNDATIEKLGMLMNENPNGLLIEREELTGLFHAMEQEGHQQDRSFYLEAWDGRNSKAIDRVMRGSLWVPSCVLSLLGTIQPGPLAQYLVRYHTEAQADGFIERFQVSVYPAPHPWGYIDEAPNLVALDRAMTVYARLHAMDGLEPLHFSADAQGLFIEWWTWLEKTFARNPRVHPLLQSHFSKYRSLMPSLALLFQLATSRTISEVRLPAIQMAAAWCNYLAGHALRIYWPVVRPGGSAMALLTEHLPAVAGQKLTARDIEKKGWAGLRSSAVIEAGLKALAPLHWARPEPAGRWGTETRWAISPSLPSLPVISGTEMNSLFSSLPPSLSSHSRVPGGGGSDGSDAVPEPAGAPF
jgi:putative DNA primase/helicase